jgi:NADPH2:quinone reductase
MLAVPADRLVIVPDAVTTKQAAAIMLQGITAHYLTHATFALKAGDTCLVHAGAGGVGLLLTQLAKMRGAAVITTVSTAEKAELSRGAGADHTINYAEQDFEAEVKRITGGRGVDVVYDSVGKATFDRSMNCVRPRGLLVFYGQSSGPIAPLDPARLAQHGSLFFTRPTIVHHIASRDELVSRAGDLLEWVAGGRLRLRIGHEFALADAAEAHRALEGRRTTGKVLLIP